MFRLSPHWEGGDACQFLAALLWLPRAGQHPGGRRVGRMPVMRCSWPAHPPHSRDQCEGSGGFLFALVPPTPGFDGHGTFLSARRVGEREQVCHMCLLFGWSLNHPIGNRLLHDPASLSCSCFAMPSALEQMRAQSEVRCGTCVCSSCLLQSHSGSKRS